MSVRVEDRGATRIVTLDRPAVRNAIDPALAEGIEAAFDTLDERTELRVGVITGSDGTFCAGMDLKAFADRPPEEATLALNRVVRRSARKPVIAAVEGHAVGGGLELAAACDLVVAARDASFGLPEVRWSLVAAGGAFVRLPARLPLGVVMDMGLTGRPIGAQRLHDLGFVARLAEPGEALDAALALALEIAANGPLAVMAVKALLSDSTEEDWVRQDRAVATVNSTADALEGVRAFVEHRTPRWTCR